MNYFTNFPKIKDTINGYEYDIIDISFSPGTDPEDYELINSTLPDAPDLGLLSLNLYDDANNYWSILYANDQINPWVYLKETPLEYRKQNKNFYGLFAKYSSSNKLNPNSHVVFQPEDIIVRGNYNNSGLTAASSVFADYATLSNDVYNLDTWFVQQAYSDTKKAKVTKNLNAGNTGIPIMGEGESILVLRKGNTGYYFLDNPFISGSKDVSSLANYNYVDSPVYFSEKNKLDQILSPSNYISATDTLITLMANDAPDAPGTAVYGDYIQTVTKTFVEYEYYSNKNYKYLNPGNFSKILSNLI